MIRFGGGRLHELAPSGGIEEQIADADGGAPFVRCRLVGQFVLAVDGDPPALTGRFVAGPPTAITSAGSNTPFSNNLPNMITD